jgi:uncharacterized protein YndB with AHSA1/START domain
MSVTADLTILEEHLVHRPTAHALIGTADRPELVFRRSYRAAPENLRGALHDPDRLARWFGEIHGGPAAVGDAFTAVLGEDPDDVAVGRVLACEEDLLQVSWSWQGEAESVITARIVPLGEGGAELRLHHALAEPGHAAGYGGGWEQTLQSLARALDEGSPQALPDEEIEAEGVRTFRLLTRAPLHIERRFAAGVDRVWRAFASAEGLRTWWWSQWPDVTIEADVRPGGAYRIQAPAVGITLEGTYLEVDAPTRLSFTWTWRDADGDSEDEAVDLHLVGQDDRGTLLTTRHPGPGADDAPAGSYRQGWADTLDALEASLAP